MTLPEGGHTCLTIYMRSSLGNVIKLSTHLCQRKIGISVNMFYALH